MAAAQLSKVLGHLRDALVEPGAAAPSDGELLNRCVRQKYRAVIVLCDLEGKTRSVAARQLGWPEGTVASRLAKRLARYGPALSGAALAALLSQNASAGVPAAVLAGTVEAGAAGVVPAQV